MAETVTWDPVSTHEFLVLLSDHAKTHHGTNPRALQYRTMAQKLWAKTNKTFEVKKLISKYFRMLQFYRAYVSLLNHTRLGWNLKTQTPTCPDEVWAEYVKQNPIAKKFKGNGLPDYDLYCIVFHRLTASRPYAHKSASQPPTVDSTREEDTQSFDNTQSLAIDTDEVVPDQNRLIGDKRPNISGGKKDKKKSSEADMIEDNIGKMMDIISYRIEASIAAARADEEASSQQNKSSPIEFRSLSTAQKILQSMQLDLPIFLAVMKFLVANLEWRQIFVEMTADQRIGWILQDFDSSD